MLKEGRKEMSITMVKTTRKSKAIFSKALVKKRADSIVLTLFGKASFLPVDEQKGYFEYQLRLAVVAFLDSCIKAKIIVNGAITNAFNVKNPRDPNYMRNNSGMFYAKDTSIQKAQRKTILENPSLFYSCCEGLTLYVEKVELMGDFDAEGNQTIKITMTPFIHGLLNGTSTLANLSRFKLIEKLSLDGVYVKLNLMVGDFDDDFITKTSIGHNNQRAPRQVSKLNQAGVFSPILEVLQKDPRSKYIQYNEGDVGGNSKLTNDFSARGFSLPPLSIEQVTRWMLTTYEPYYAIEGYGGSSTYTDYKCQPVPLYTQEHQELEMMGQLYNIFIKDKKERFNGDKLSNRMREVLKNHEAKMRTGFDLMISNVVSVVEARDFMIDYILSSLDKAWNKFPKSLINKEEKTKAGDTVFLGSKTRLYFVPNKPTVEYNAGFPYCFDAVMLGALRANYFFDGTKCVLRMPFVAAAEILLKKRIFNEMFILYEKATKERYAMPKNAMLYDRNLFNLMARKALMILKEKAGF